MLGELRGRGAAVHLLDLSDFPQRLAIELRYGNRDGRRLGLKPAGGAALDLAACGAIWWRRPQAFAPDPAIARGTHASFTYNESQEAFSGLWQALDGVWVNHPTRDEVAGRKAFQLRVAQEAGLDIPETLITNDPAAAAAFVDARGDAQTIFKTFSATAAEWRETRLLREPERALIGHVRYAPVIFQEYIPGGRDLRITIVGDSIFPAAIDSHATSYPVDFRMDMANAPIRAVELTTEMESGLRRLMTRLGLVYGAIDMREHPDGRLVFLEINPAGQWLFVEERTGQPITTTLAETLMRFDAGGRRP